MTYSEFLRILEPFREEKFAAFQQKIIRPPRERILGIRTPEMRRLAGRFRENLEEILAFPDEYYEVTFLKLTLVSMLPYEKFLLRLDECLPLIDNWALCDCFKADCLKKHREDFLPRLEKIFSREEEFYQRYVLVTLLSFYADEEKYLPIAEEYLRRADTGKYYVHMAAAWLTAEILIKHYEWGLGLLQRGVLSPETHDKAIQKARESYRLTPEQKGYLQSLKIHHKS